MPGRYVARRASNRTQFACLAKIQLYNVQTSPYQNRMITKASHFQLPRRRR